MISDIEEIKRGFQKLGFLQTEGEAVPDGDYDVPFQDGLIRVQVLKGLIHIRDELKSKKPDFQAFPKLHRFNREIIVTEKIDGTNAQIVVSDDGTELWPASRTRFISVGDDNFGFAAWCEKHKEELLKLGPGRHFGEWWGAGIQRRYGLSEKRFSLFNVQVWHEENTPECVDVVPVLWQGLLCNFDARGCLDQLAAYGSRAAPGFMKPEGIVIYHTHARVSMKMTLDNEDTHKGNDS